MTQHESALVRRIAIYSALFGLLIGWATASIVLVRL